MTDAIPIQPGSIVGGCYRVDRVVGAGSMSIVVAATHLEIERSVAIKFLNPLTARPDSSERFRREAQNAARLKNEHVVRVIDIGALAGGLPFIVMDLLEGRNLHEELLERGPFPVAEAVRLVLQAIEALAEAHALGIVHRDLKPANLFLAERADRSRTVKVLDFGVSKSLLDSHGEVPIGLTQTGMIVGSPLYMPPEQLQSARSVDHRADIWALGAVLYELVTGRVPYEAKSYPELCTRILSEPPPLARPGEDIPAAFEGVVRRCLASDREARFQSVSELASALAPFAGTDSELWRTGASKSVPGGSESATVFAGPKPSSSSPRAKARRVTGVVVLGASIAGGALYVYASSTKPPGERALEQRPAPKGAVTDAGVTAETRPPPPAVTPVEDGSVLAAATASPSTVPAASASAAPPLAPGVTAVTPPGPRAVSAHSPRFAPVLATSPAPSSDLPPITDFGGRK